MTTQEVIIGGSVGVTLGEAGTASFTVENAGALEVEYEIQESAEVPVCYQSGITRPFIRHALCLCCN